jgi:O-antigen/teichoic acid export membrane protein
MDPAKRIIVNTGVQYVKAIITTCLSLYSTRLILDALNVNDFGIYSVIAGIVAMLGFITNALIITTQRYLSVYKAKEDTAFMHKLFSNSLLIHLLFGLLISIILLALEGLLFEYVLNIEAARISTAKMVYIIAVLMLFFTILTSPFKALFIAHENIIYIASVEIADSIIKLLLAIGLAYVTIDKLLVYAIMMAIIVSLNLLAFSLYGMIRFKECSMIIQKRDIDRMHIKNLTGFAGWTTYGMACVAARNQGTAVVLNHFFSTVVNAAYGIAFQINGAIVFLVVSIQNAMNPQLMQAEGAGNRKKMLDMATQLSKFSVAILNMAIIPLAVEMPAILGLWLKEVPEGTTMFCRFILIAFLADQITLGLSSANQAMGCIRNFTLLTYTPKLIYLFIIWMILAQGGTAESVMVLYAAVELAIALIRIPYMKYKAGLCMTSYCKEVIIPILLQSSAVAGICWLCTLYITHPYRFVATVICAVAIGMVTGWTFVLNSSERNYTKGIIKKMTERWK